MRMDEDPTEKTDAHNSHFIDPLGPGRPPFSGPPTSESHRRTTSIRPLFFVNVGDSDARCGLFNLCIEFFIDACDVGSEHEAHRFHLGNEHRVRLLKRGDRLAHGDEIVLLLV